MASSYVTLTRSVAVFLVCSTIAYNNPSASAKPQLRIPTCNDEHDEINLYLQRLNFNRNSVLAYRSTATTSFIPKEAHYDQEKNFIVVTRERKSVAEGRGSIGVVTTNVPRTYPGSILLANSNLMDNQPDAVTIGRSPMEYTVDLPGLSRAEGIFTITPNYSEYTTNLNRVRELWFEKYSPKYKLAANFESEYSFVKSREQLRVKLGTEFKSTQLETNVDFEGVMKNEKTILITKFKQIFYTVSVPAPRYPADLFDASVRLQEVKSRMSSKSPPLLVDSVSYGRVVYVQIETTSTNDTAKATLESQFSGFLGLNSTVDYTKLLDNFSMRVYVMGGSTDHVELINARTPKDIHDILFKLRDFDRTNLGFPLTYSGSFVNDNSRAMVQGYADYTETKREILTSGWLRLEHYGGYVVRYYIYWDEVTYDKEGAEHVVTKAWDENDYDKYAPCVQKIRFPGNVRNIQVKIMASTLSSWRTIIDRKGIPLIKHRAIKVDGTILLEDSLVNPEE